MAACGPSDAELDAQRTQIASDILASQTATAPTPLVVTEPPAPPTAEPTSVPPTETPALAGPARPMIQQAKLNAEDAEANDFFGDSVSLDGNTAVVGSIGSAYVFVRSGTTWSQEAKLIAADAEAGNTFGSSVAISGDTILVGAPFAGPEHGGLAYVFVRSGTTWSQEAKLNAADAEWFGGSVAISGDTVLVGAFSESPDLGAGPIEDAGSAYVFTRSGTAWSQEAKLNSGDAEADDRFGRSVALAGDTALVGAFMEDPDLGGGPIEDAGSAYVFTRSGTAWSQEAKLNSGDAEAAGLFGFEVAVDGDTAVVGASYESPDLGGGAIDHAGSAYVFTRSGTAWSQQAKLNAADAEVGDQFGSSVALSGDTILVGARFEDPDLGGGPLTDAGSVYVFVRSGTAWSQQAKLNAADAEGGSGEEQPGDFFGAAIALSGDTVLVGALFEAPDLGGGPTENAGSAYVFGPD